jgi:hypothetical protein
MNTLTLKPEFLTKGGKRQFAVLPYEDFVAMQKRMEDMEDLVELRRAKRAEGNKPGVSLAAARRRLGIR